MAGSEQAKATTLKTHAQRFVGMERGSILLTHIEMTTIRITLMAAVLLARWKLDGIELEDQVRLKILERKYEEMELNLIQIKLIEMMVIR